MISTLQPRTCQGASETQGFALSVCEERKIAAHAASCRAIGVSFVPLAFESLGGCSKLTAETLTGMWGRDWVSLLLLLLVSSSRGALSLCGGGTPLCGCIAFQLPHLSLKCKTLGGIHMQVSHSTAATHIHYTSVVCIYCACACECLAAPHARRGLTTVTLAHARRGLITMPPRIANLPGNVCTQVNFTSSSIFLRTSWLNMKCRLQNTIVVIGIGEVNLL